MDDRTKTARRNFDQATTVGENIAQDAQVRYGAAMDNARDRGGDVGVVGVARDRSAVSVFDFCISRQA